MTGLVKCPQCGGEHTLDHCPRWRSETPADDEPIAWVHTMYMECDQSRTVATLSENNPFGEPGIDYSKSYAVISVPAYAPSPADNSSAAPSDPKTAFEAWAEKDGTYDLRPAKWTPISHRGVPHTGYVKAYENDRTRYTFEGFSAALATPSVQAVAAPVAHVEGAKKALEASEEYLNADGESRTYKWLSTAAKDGIPEVKQAAYTMMAYYCGAEFPAASPVELTDAEAHDLMQRMQAHVQKWADENDNDDADEDCFPAFSGECIRFLLRHLSSTAGKEGAAKHQSNCLCDSCVNPLL